MVCKIFTTSSSGSLASGKVVGVVVDILSLVVEVRIGERVRLMLVFLLMDVINNRTKRIFDGRKVLEEEKEVGGGMDSSKGANKGMVNDVLLLIDVINNTTKRISVAW
jgi:hypothetical protein